MKNFLLILSIVCLSFSGYANREIVVKGNILGIRGGQYANKPVQVSIIEDFITNTKKVIKKGTTDQHGNFNLKLNLPNIEFAFIEFEKVERTLYLTPGKTYFVKVQAPLKDLSQSHGFFAKDSRSAIIVNKRKQEINYLIDSLEQLTSDFLFNFPGRRRNYPAVKLFTDSLEANFKPVKNSFFQKYLTYKVGEMHMFGLRAFRKDFAKKYFDSQSGVCDHIQSMHVFNTFFKGHMKNGIQTQDNSPFHNYILKGDLDRMLTEVYKTETYNKELNELILLKGLFEISNSYFYRKSRLNKTLDKIISNTAYPRHAIIAKNIKGKLNHLENGYAAPNIQLTYSGTQFNLSDYRGKYVYLCFFKGWDTQFEKEIKIINYLKQRYEKDLEVVCISTDIDTSTYHTFLKGQLDQKNIFHYNYKAKILMDYRLKDFRVQNSSIAPGKYFLISPQGTIVYGDAKAPSQGFEYDLRKIIIQ